MTRSNFTPAEAAAVTGLPVKKVNKAIETGTVASRSRRQGRTFKRYLPYTSLLCLELQARGLDQLPLTLRRKVFRSVARAPRANQIRHSDAVIIDVRSAREKIVMGLLQLRKAKRMIIRDPEIMGGVPVFRGTRVPVYAIVEMLQSASRKEILEGYPSLTVEMLDVAEQYVRAYPKRGRPPSQPWHQSAPRRLRGKLAA